MMYDNYTVDDFILDEGFRNWVLYPDQASREFWRQWIKDHPDKRSLIEEARSIILMAEYDEITSDETKTERSWQALDARIREEESQYAPSGRTTPAVTRYLSGAVSYRVAAVFALLMLSFAAYYYYSSTVSIDYATAFGEVSTFELPDGSQVILNANSRISFRDASLFNAHTREVTLEGEAYFIVKRVSDGNTPQKFVVDANATSVEVLGTAFNVNNRRGRTVVVLNSGKVQLKTTRPGVAPLIMKPGELAQLSEDEGKFVVENIDPEMYTGWRTNQLIFQGNTLREIFEILEDHYGYELVTGDSVLLNKKFKGSFPADRPDILLSALSETFDVKFNQKHKRITIEHAVEGRP